MNYEKTIKRYCNKKMQIELKKMRQMPKKYQFASGMTILELIVAMAISGIVVSLVMVSYLNVSKGFFLQINKSAQVMHMATSKKQIDRLVSTIGVVMSIREVSLDYLEKESDSLVTISFEKNTLKKGSSIVIKNLDGFTWSILQPAANSGKGLLYWEAHIGNGWIGGASEVIKQ